MQRLSARSLASCFVLLWLAAAAAAQSVRTPVHPIATEVHGQVRYATSKEPVDHALVRLEAFGSGIIGQVMTDRTGKFQFTGMANAQYVLTVHAPGYRDYQQTVDLLTTSSDYVTVSLVADPSAARASTPLLAPAVIDARVPVTARTEFERGRALLLGGAQGAKLQEGLRHLEKAIELYPEFLEAQLLLGLGYLDAQAWDRAEQALRRTLEINPKAATAHFALGEAYRRQRKYDEAEQALTAGLRLDERSYRGHYELGRTYFERGDIFKAGPHVGRALQLKPDFADGHLLAGNILLRARQAENALAEFEEYLRLAPKGEYAAQARVAARKIRQALGSAQRP